MTKVEIEEQKQQLSRIDQGVAYLKRVWPALLILCTIFMAGMWVQGFWMNVVAKKADTDRIYAQQVKQGQQMTSFLTEFKEHKRQDVIYRDSVKKIIESDRIANKGDIERVNSRLSFILLRKDRILNVFP